MKEQIIISSACGDIGRAANVILESTNHGYDLVNFDAFPKNNCKELNAVSISPRANTKEFNGWVEDLLGDRSCAFYIPCSEPEIDTLSRATTLANRNKIVWAGARVFQLLNDKLLASAFLEKHGFTVAPRVKWPLQTNENVFPCVVKPRFKSGSRSIFICNTPEEVNFAISSIEYPIIQRLIPDENSEYTVAVYRDVEGETRVVNFKRVLLDGRTQRAELVVDQTVINMCKRLVSILDLVGSINIQIRKNAGINYIFEINPRFSSTLQARHLVGFCDLLWSLGIETINSQEEINSHHGAVLIRDSSGIFHLT